MLIAMTPLLVWLFLGLLIFARGRLAITLRESLLVSVTVCAGWLVLGIELLSLFRAIQFWPVFIWWLVPLLVLAGLLLREIRGGRKLLPKLPRLKMIDYALVAAIVVILGWSFCQATFSPPNNVDSQEYHLARQVFWKQQGSVEHFPTNNPRQLVMPPLTEFGGLTLMVLTGNDHYHNLVQWLAFLLTLFAVSLTTRRFQASSTGQLLAALWVATIPLAFLQASTTKNDVVVMMWICLLVYWVLALDRARQVRWRHVVLLGVAFGAVNLTKGTGTIFSAPLALLGAYFLFRTRWRRAVPALVIIGGITLLLNAGHFVRNYRVFGSIAPDTPGIHGVSTVGNQDHSAGAVLSNMLRTMGSHLVTPSQYLNDKLTESMRAIHEKLGRNIDDPKTTWMPGGRFRPYQFSQDDEDKAAAPGQMFLLLLFPIFLLVARREVPWRGVVPIFLVFLAGFVLFSFVLKWQNWHVRLVITLPAILSPIFGWIFGARRFRYLILAPAIFLVLTLAPSFNCIPRPLLGAKNIFGADWLALRCYYHPNWADDYRRLADQMEKKHPRVVGFSTPVSSPDYPMERLLLDRFNPPPLFTAFNASQGIPGQVEVDPDALLVAGGKSSRVQHASTGTWYRKASTIGRYTLFFKE